VTEAISVLKQIVDSSAQLSASGLAVFGETVAAVLGTSFRRPLALRWRLPFLLFLPGWFCLGMSLYLGNVISGRYLAATMVSPATLANIATRVNDEYANQRDWLFYSLTLFAIWLAVYLVYWIFIAKPKELA
jgi:hypothetical protein